MKNGPSAQRSAVVASVKQRLGTNVSTGVRLIGAMSCACSPLWAAKLPACAMLHLVSRLSPLPPLDSSLTLSSTR